MLGDNAHPRSPMDTLVTHPGAPNWLLSMCYFERWSKERILKSLCSFTLARSALLSLTSRLQTKGPNQDSQEDQTGVFEADILKAFQLAADYSYALVPCALQLAVD